MNGLVNGAELGRLLRPLQPLSRKTIYNWTRDGRIPKAAVFYVGSRIRYRVPVLIEAGWIMPDVATAANQAG